MQNIVHRIDIELEETNRHLRSEIESLALNEYGAIAVNCYSLEESEVDEILGDLSYCGGNLPDSLAEKLDLRAIETGKFSIYFNSKSFDENPDNDIVEFLKILEANKVKYQSSIEDMTIDWNAKWRESYKKIEVDSGLTIVPSWMQSEKESSLYIYPGMGFGTGTHETTYMSLKLFRELMLDKSRVFNKCIDFGCGSGILGIAAIKFFPNIDVLFYDIDDSAIENTKQNLDLNELSCEDYTLATDWSSDYEQNQSELVFANILENVLIENKERISSSVKPEGSLILSGILIEQKENILKEYLPLGFKEVKILSQNNWVAILLEKLR